MEKSLTKVLFCFELKKILKRKMVWISLVLSILVVCVTMGASLLGSYYVDGERIGSNYEMFQIDMAYQKALDGRPIDETLLREMQEAYSKVPLDAAQYSLTEEYQKYARPYSAIFNYVRQTTGMYGMEAIQWVVNAENLHTKRLERQEMRWEDFRLSGTEKAFWRAEEEKIENPVIFRYAEGYTTLLSGAYTVGFLTVFVIAVCLAGVFPEEHVRKTDQLVLSTKYGRNCAYWAKFLAGTVFAFFMALILLMTSFVTAFLLYGTEGFNAAFQLLYAGSSLAVSAGEAVIISYIMVLFAGTFMGVLVMMLSEVLHNSIGTLGIAMGIIILPMMVTISEEYRFPAQLWSYLPGEIAGVWNAFNPRTVEIFGDVFQSWQAVPVLYTILGIAFAFVTKRAFVTYQVSGR